jgi:hypothetical protein
MAAEASALDSGDVTEAEVWRKRKDEMTAQLQANSQKKKRIKR